jgi:hypothetical protein
MYNLNIKTKTHENIQFKFLNLNKFEIFANERNTKAHNIDLQSCLFLLTNKILILQVIQAIKLYPLKHSQILAFVEVDLFVQPSLVHHHKQCLIPHKSYLVLVSLKMFLHIHG